MLRVTVTTLSQTTKTAKIQKGTADQIRWRKNVRSRTRYVIAWFRTL